MDEKDGGEEELAEQRREATEAHGRRLDFVAAEAERGQAHGRDLTEDAIDSTYSREIENVFHLK